MGGGNIIMRERMVHVLQNQSTEMTQLHSAFQLTMTCPFSDLADAYSLDLLNMEEVNIKKTN